MRDIKIDSTNQLIYVVEGTSVPKIALGQSRIIQINVSTGVTTVLCEATGQIESVFSQSERQALVLGYGHPRDTLPSLLNLLDRENQICLNMYGNDPKTYSGIAFVKPYWFDDTSFLAILPVSQLMRVETNSAKATLLFSDWWIDDYEPIPGTGNVLIVGAPKSESNVFDHKPKFAQLNVDTSELKELPFLPNQGGTINFSPDGRHFIYLTSSTTDLSTYAILYELMTGEVKLIQENATDLDWSKDGRYLIVTTNDRFIQFDVITGKSVDLGAANGAVLLKVDY